MYFLYLEYDCKPTVKQVICVNNVWHRLVNCISYMCIATTITCTSGKKLNCLVQKKFQYV